MPPARRHRTLRATRPSRGSDGCSWPITPGQGGTAVIPGTAERRSARHRLAEITVPVTVAGGDLDVPFIVDRCRQLAGRLPIARHFVLAGMAHQPYLESASTVAQLIRSAVTGGGKHAATRTARRGHAVLDREG
jgi:pimeloyl-ACP methyl ester carboxylesterase